MQVIDSILRHQFYSPDRTAFSENDTNVSYRSFFVHAERIRNVLLHHGVKPGDSVALLLPRGISAACCIYGTLFAGACYVPMDIQNPVSRLSYIIGDVQPHCVIGDGERPDWCSASVAWIDINDPAFFKDEPQDDVDVIYRSGAEDIAAILYTSGSTGNPKGVSISCRAIDAFVDWSSTTFGITANDLSDSLIIFNIVIIWLSLFFYPWISKRSFIDFGIFPLFCPL